MSGGSSANNSWTILPPEESLIESLRPLTERTEHHEESPTHAAGSSENQSACGTESAEGLPVSVQPVSEEKPAELSGDKSTEPQPSVPTSITNATVPTSLEVSHTFTTDHDALSQSEGLPEVPAQPSPDSFSDSYTNVTPSPDEPPATLLNTETLGAVEPPQKETLLGLNWEGLQQKGVESDLCQRTTDVGKWADSPMVSEGREQKPGPAEAEPEVNRRRSLLAALERIGRTEEEEEDEEEKEEEFHLPQREGDSGFSVNKCILGAVILLGLGTMFFSGVFMDLDEEESNYATRELKDTELPEKQEWLNPEVPPPPVDAQNAELLNKLAKGNQQISLLQAQLQTQEEELEVAKGQAAEGAKERVWWEEVEKENSRLKKEMASLPVLQKENQRMKRELESVPALHKELDTLRATVTELKLSPAATEATQAPVKAAPSPPSGQPEDSTVGYAERQQKQPLHDQREKNKYMKKDKREKKDGEKYEWKEWEHKDEGKKGKHEPGTFDNEKHDKGKPKRYSYETKAWRDQDKAGRGDEGKSWKDREGDKEWKEKIERKEWKDEKDCKKVKQVNEGMQWKEGKKDRKVGREHNGREEWRGEKEPKKEKDGYKESGKDRWEKKERGEKKEWKKNEWDGKRSGKDHSKEGKWKGERKQWEESKNHGKDGKGKDEGNKNKWKSENDNHDDEEWKRKNERKQWNESEWKSRNGRPEKEGKRSDERKEWEKKDQQRKTGGKKEAKDWDKHGSHKPENKYFSNHGHEKEHVWGDRKPSHTHQQLSMEQPEYWVRQRSRLQRNPKSQHCVSMEACATTEGLQPVPLPEFEAILQTYLAKAEKVGVAASIREELKKFAAEYFKDGLFVHDQMRFRDFVEDLEDVLEDMVERDDGEEEDSAIEEEMDGFEREVMKKFSLPGAGEKQERSKGEWRKESGQGRG